MIAAIFFTGVSVGMAACCMIYKIVEWKHRNKNQTKQVKE